MPLFSVIMPCWNAQKTIADTIESVLCQSFGDFELIIVDDGSTDDTSNIVARYASVDRRVRVVELENGGPSRARNIAAFVYATGSLLAFLDSDDIWAPEKLLRMAETFRRRGAADAVYARIAFFRNTIDVVETESTPMGGPLTAGDLIRENAVCTMSNIVVRADIFEQSGGFDTSLKYGEDMEWLIRLVGQGARIEAVDERLVYYRACDHGLSADLSSMEANWKASVATALAHDPRIGASDVRKAEAVHLRYLARRALRLKTPPLAALGLALRGAGRSPSAFFENPRRGVMTLMAALANPLMPSAVRRMVFYR
ncbi:glycosyltransferase [Hoeflea sp. WL0058]|uniref:Glycosyltransferase n=1 Tax=Flavimaribacter sediminis TaxID=2865987 RepID=A0AAE2ZMH3_9HYPH|nr:glycosyltransferase [Flavimaribacter sediminis]MBW8638921.1 glycosyltransferase [Flavimaribacter sediminis]